MTAPDDLRNLRSALEDRPDYVQAIGMLTIEIGNLEMELARILAALLGISYDVAHVIYFTPRGVFGRLEIITNVAEKSLDKLPEVLTQTLGTLGRSKTVFGKRHTIVHSVWGINPDNSEVFTVLPPITTSDHFAARKYVPLNVLTDVVRDARALIDESINLSARIAVRLNTVASLQTPGPPEHP